MGEFQPEIIWRYEQRFEEEVTSCEEVNKDSIIRDFSDSRRKEEPDNFYGFIHKENGEVRLANDDEIKQLENKLSRHI
jgi:hypothetical protein